MLWPLGYPSAPDSVSSQIYLPNPSLTGFAATRTQLTRKMKSGQARITITEGSRILKISPIISVTSSINQQIQEWDGLTFRFLFEAMPLEIFRLISGKGGNYYPRKKSVLFLVRLAIRLRA